MSFDWSQYVDVAKELYEQAKTAPQPLQEAKFRASISRAYYATFGKARDQLRRRDRIMEPRPPAEIHQYVRNTFMNSQDVTRQEIGANLDRLRRYRNAADYDLQNTLIHNLPITTQAVLTLAKKTLAALNRL